MLRLITAVFIAAGLFPAVHGKNDLFTYRAASFSYYFPQKSVEVVKTAYQEPGLSFLVLHDDENTGVEAAHDFCKTAGGILLNFSMVTKEISLSDTGKQDFPSILTRCLIMPALIRH